MAVRGKARHIFQQSWHGQSLAKVAAKCQALHIALARRCEVRPGLRDVPK